MTDQLIRLCRIYYEDENFRNRFENEYKKLTNNLDESKERFYINSYSFYKTNSEHLWSAPMVYFYYQINRRDTKYPDYGEMVIPYSEQPED